jgi:hypothetical protein
VDTGGSGPPVLSCIGRTAAGDSEFDHRPTAALAQASALRIIAGDLVVDQKPTRESVEWLLRFLVK